MIMYSIGSWTLPSMVLVTTCGFPAVSSKPSRRICSTRIARASSPRPWTSQASGRWVGRTLIETLPISSLSSRSLTCRAVTLAPLTRPASGEVLMPMVMEIAGSSTVISGRGFGFSGSVRVSPMVMSSIPATATMSPGPASSAGTRSRAWVFSSSEIRTFLICPSCRAQATVWPFLRVPWKMRSNARRPRNGEESRLVTWACSTPSGS